MKTNLVIAITNNQRTEISPSATDIWIDKKVGNNLLVVITHKSIKSLDEINLDKKNQSEIRCILMIFDERSKLYLIIIWWKIGPYKTPNRSKLLWTKKGKNVNWSLQGTLQHRYYHHYSSKKYSCMSFSTMSW